MRETNLETQTRVLLIISALCAISLFHGTRSAIANADDIYLQWEGDDQEVGGYLTIAGFPAVFEVGKTYRITATFSLEKLEDADAVEFGRIDWALATLDRFYTIGYSSLDANLTKHDENSTISHWEISEKPTTGGGNLAAIATIKLHNSTDPDKAEQNIRIFPSVKVTLKVESVLRMNPTTFHVEQGHAIKLNGTLMPIQGGATITLNDEEIPAFLRPEINLVITDPNGDKITKSVIADYYGNFTYTFRPNVTGVWYVTAGYNGSSYFFPSTSNVVTVRVGHQFPWAALLAIISLLALAVAPFGLQRYRKTARPTQKKYGSRKKSVLVSIIILAVISISIIWLFATTGYPTHSDVFWLGVQSGVLAGLLLICLGLIGFLSQQLTKKQEQNAAGT